jgi:hypothetical protein
MAISAVGQAGDALGGVEQITFAVLGDACGVDVFP